jgi:hypothetical protein
MTTSADMRGRFCADLFAVTAGLAGPNNGAELLNSLQWQGRGFVRVLGNRRAE